MPPWDAYKPQQPAAPAAEPAGPSPTFDAIPDQSAAPIDKPAPASAAKEGPWDAFKRQDIVKAMPLAGEMPMTGPMMDEYVKNSAVGKIIDAFGEGFGPVDAKNAIGIQPGGEAEKELQRRGLLTDMNQTHYDLMKSFNEGIVRPTAFAGDIALRTMSGAFRAGQEALKQATTAVTQPILGAQSAESLGRDVAAIPEMLQGHPHGLGMAEPPRAPEPIRVAKSLDVIGKGEAGWKGFTEATTDTADDQVKRWREAMEDYNTPPTPGVAMARMAEPVEAPKGADIHQAAREIAPDTFREYDALQAKRDTYRRWIGDLGEARAESPEIKPIQDRIDTILGKVKGVEDRLTKSAAERLAQARADIEEKLSTDTKDMAFVRREMRELDYRMRDLAPEVSDAYRQARERVPVEEPAPAAETASGPMTVQSYVDDYVAGRGRGSAEHEQFAANNSGAIEEEFKKRAEGERGTAAEKPTIEPEPLEAAVAKPALKIAEDVSKKLVDVGRPKEEADAAAALIAAHYEARAARFRGAKGTAAELYAKEGPQIRAAGQRAAVEPVREFAQGEKVSTLKGDEIAGSDADVKTLRTAAKSWYRENLSGTSVDNPKLGPVEFTRRGLNKAIHESANPLKLRIFPALPDIISKGEIVGSELNRDLASHPNVVRYHWIEAPVEIGGETHRVRVALEERTDGKIYYNHTLPDQSHFQEGIQAESPSKAGGGSADGTPEASAARSGPAGSRPSEENIAQNGQKLNLEIVDRSPQEFDQAAFHGSPHAFDKFTTDHIGSGEGAQAYGWGLYFAGKKKVAEYYRNALSKQRGTPSYEGQTILNRKGEPLRVQPEWHGEMEAILRHAVDNKITLKEAIADAVKQHAETGFLKRLFSNIGGIKKFGAFLEERGATIGDEQKGRLYHVELAPKDDELLHWDKPLSEQPPKVREALARAGIKEPEGGQARIDELTALKERLAKERLPDNRMRDERAWHVASAEVERLTREMRGTESGASIYRKLSEQMAKRRVEEPQGWTSVQGGPVAYDGQVHNPRAASLALKDEGVRGIKYQDAGSRGSEGGSHNYVIFDGADVAIKEFEQSNRGKIAFKNDQAVITLFKDADASTFLHETGHQWLEELMGDARDERAPDDLVQDAKTVRDWLGAEEGAPITRKQHEQFARGFERYLMEGRAPTRALADVFAKFKDWLTRIYDTVSRLRSPINDDIRDVFDRLVSKGREDVTIAPEPKEATGTLGARHEKLAETTPPEEAQAVAETVRTEADEHAEKEDKTVHAEITGPQVSGEQPSAGEPVEPAGRGDAAGGPRGNPPADQEAGGDGSGGRPAAQEGEADRGAGTEREGGAEPAPEGAGARADGDDAGRQPTGPHDDRPDAVVDNNLAGNIRLENLPGDTAIKDRLRQFAADNADWVAARRGVVSDQEVMDLADSMGIDARKLNIQKLRDMSVEDGIPLAARIVGGRQEMIAAVGKAVTAAEKASQSGSLEDIQAYVQAKTWALHVAETIAGITAEMGRGLRGFRDISDTGPKDYKQIIEFMQNATGRTPEQLRAEATAMAQTKTTSQAAKLAQDSLKPKFKDMFLSYFINNLISGPLTHGAYMAGNEVYQLVKITATTPVAAAIGAAREALGKAEAGERVYMREAWAQMYAHGRAAIYGIGPAYQAFKTGIVTMKGDLHGEGAMPGGENALRRQIIPGTAGYVLETPSRAVSAIHMMHYGMNYEAEVSRLAFRSAMGEGLEVGSHAFNEYLARFTQDTPEPVMEEAHKQAMRMVLMRRPAYDSSAAALQRFVNSHVLAKLVVPFMQIGGSILREGYLEHTPLGALVDPEIKARLRGEQGDAARDTQYAQMAVGTGVSLGVLFAAGQGIVTGGGPTDPKQRAALEMTGWQPYSLHLGEKYIPYRKYLGPLGPLVGGVANMHEVGHAMSEGDYTAAATAAIIGFSEVIADETWMRGVANFLDAVRHWDRDGGKYLRNLAMDFIPFSVGMSQISRLIDPERRDVRSWPDAAQAHIPVASEGLHPVRDIFGNAMPSRTMLSPSTMNDDPVLRDLIATDSFPSRLERKIRGVDLTEQQYDDFGRIAGRLTRMALLQVINQPGWADVPLGIRHEVLTKVVEKSREAARAQIMLQAVGSDNDIMKKAAANKLEKLRRGQPVEGPAWGTEGPGQTKLTPELANSAPAAVFR